MPDAAAPRPPVTDGFNLWLWMLDKYGYEIAFREWLKLDTLREKRRG